MVDRACHLGPYRREHFRQDTQRRAMRWHEEPLLALPLAGEARVTKCLLERELGDVGGSAATQLASHCGLKLITRPAERRAQLWTTSIIAGLTSTAVQRSM